jgi:hypothetical protein
MLLRYGIMPMVFEREVKQTKHGAIYEHSSA